MHIQTRRPLLPVLLSVLLLPLAGSCVAVAVGAGVGLLISQELIDNESIRARVSVDVEDVWASAQELMQTISSAPPSIVQDTRTATGVFEGADVAINVLAYDFKQTDVLIGARKFGVRDGLVSQKVLDLLLERLERRQN
jgi:hypothetical protein